MAESLASGVEYSGLIIIQLCILNCYHLSVPLLIFTIYGQLCVCWDDMQQPGQEETIEIPAFNLFSSKETTGSVSLSAPPLELLLRAGAQVDRSCMSAVCSTYAF